MLLTNEKPFNTHPPVTSGDVSPFQKAKLEGKLPQHYLNRLSELRSFPDEIPDKIIRPWNNPNWPMMKCMGGAITAIRHSIAAVLDHGLVQDEQTSLTLRIFLQHKVADRTTSQDIRLLNEALDTAINYLCLAYQLEKPNVDYRALLESTRSEHGLKPGQLAPDPGIDE